MSKEHWPEFPLVWMKESRRNMAGLHDLAVHLHQKAEANRMRGSGFRGDATEMEKQIIDRLSALQEDVTVLTDVVQAMLPIIYEDHWRRSHRITRAVAWISHAAKQHWHKVEQNILYRILSVVGAAITLVFIITVVLRLLGVLRR